MMYKDKRGWLFCVNCREPERSLHKEYKAFYCNPKKKKWQPCSSPKLDWRDSARKAELDLASYARKHDMVTVKGR